MIFPTSGLLRSYAAGHGEAVDPDSVWRELAAQERGQAARRSAAPGALTEAEVQGLLKAQERLAGEALWDPAKPRGLTRLQEWAWAWEGASEGARRRLAWVKALENLPERELDRWGAGGEWKGTGPEPPEWARRAARRGTPLRQIERNFQERRTVLTDAELEDWKARNPLFIRFGALPPGKRSAASADMVNDPQWEKGISVFRARRTPEGDYVVDTAPSPTQVEMFWFCLHEKRPAYLAEGREVGAGGDGEPVLEDVTLTPIPEDAAIRSSGHWELRVGLRYAGMLLVGASPFLEERFAPPYDAGSEWGGEAAGLPFPGARELVEAVLERSTGKASTVHGPEHWKRVAVAGAALCEGTPEADPLTVFLFALFHDAARIFDTFDTWHGWRAAELARELLAELPLSDRGDVLSPERLEVLAYALEHHDSGKVSEDPTIGACWDADRLTLWRIGVEPVPRLLSTAAAKERGRIEWARGLQGTPFSWAEACACYHPEPSIASLRKPRKPGEDGTTLTDPRVAHREELRQRKRLQTRLFRRKRTLSASSGHETPDPLGPPGSPMPTAGYQNQPGSSRAFSPPKAEVRNHLERWGVLEDWDRRRAQGEAQKAEAPRDYLTLKELEELGYRGEGGR